MVVNSAGLVLTDEFRHALELLAGGRHVFLTGKAGTGKSTLIRLFMAETDRAVVVRAGAPQTLTLRATDLAAALRLGFLAGHLHWKVNQHDDTLVVHLEGSESDYTPRIAELLESGRIESLELTRLPDD